jgi:hypothetical protein
MSNAITNEEAAQVLNSLPEKLKPVMERLLSTVALQAEIIDELLWKLEIEDTGNTMKRKILGQAIAQMAAMLSNPVVEGPTLGEIQAATKQMRDDIASAKSAQEIFSTILSFATKIAPLL